MLFPGKGPAYLSMPVLTTTHQDYRDLNNMAVKKTTKKTVKKVAKKKASVKKLTELEKGALVRLERWARPQYDELCQQYEIDPSSLTD
tara:strand:- start:39 stop:302 length:264 start_codon:yes stop_codon:yes gene_type:complete